MLVDCTYVPYRFDKKFFAGGGGGGGGNIRVRQHFGIRHWYVMVH